MPKKKMSKTMAGIIQLDSDFSIARNNYEWVLMRHYATTNKKGEPSVKTKTTYHPTLKSVAKSVLETRAAGASSVDELITAFDTGVMALSLRLEEAVIKATDNRWPQPITDAR